MAGVTAITVIGNDASDAASALPLWRQFVDQIIVTVQPSTDSTESVCRQFADIVIASESNTLHLETYYEQMISLAANDIILEIYPDEQVIHGDQLRRIADLPYDVWWLRRVDYINGERTNLDAGSYPRMHRKGALKWKKQMHSFPDVLMDRQCETKEVWLQHNRTIERIRLRQAQFSSFATEHGEAERVNPMHDAFLAKAESVHGKQQASNYPRHILLAYNGVVGIGDTLMTIPAVREIRRQYPNAEITYLTQKEEVLRGCPYIDVIDTTKPELWKAEKEARFDITVHWEGSLTGDAGHRLNGYELESMTAHVDPESYLPEWWVSKTEARFAKNFLSQVKTPRTVGMALSASCLHRTWPHSEEFVENLLDRYPDVTLIFFGDDKCRLLEMDRSSRIRKVRDQWGVERLAQVDYDGPGHDRIIRTSGRLKLREVAAVIQKLDCLIAPDSGLMHVGAAMQVPTVAYFNLVPASLRVKHFPWVIPVEAQYECSPCFVHGTIACDKTTETGAPCLHTVTVERMLEAVKEVLG